MENYRDSSRSEVPRTGGISVPEPPAGWRDTKIPIGLCVRFEPRGQDWLSDECVRLFTARFCVPYTAHLVKSPYGPRTEHVLVQLGDIDLDDQALDAQ